MGNLPFSIEVIQKSKKHIYFKMKDTNAPRRPLTGYMRFIATIRAEVEAETGLNGIKVTPHLSARWNALSDDEKDTFNQQFKKEMAKHKKLMTAYKKTPAYKEFQQKKKAKKFGKKPKDKNAPKRPSTAFFIFANEIRDSVRSDNPDASIGQIGKILGQQWNALNESQKQKYQAKKDALKAMKKAEKESTKKSTNNKKKVVRRRR